MEITLKPARGNKTATSKLQKRFDRLCSQVESAEKRNRNLDSQLDELVRRHDELMREVDQGIKPELEKLGNRLVDFLTRKTLSRRQRQELADWIGDVGMRLETSDRDAAWALHERFHAAMDAVYGGLEDVDEASDALEDGIDDLFGDNDADYDDDAYDEDDEEWPGPEDAFDEGFAGAGWQQRDGFSASESSSKLTDPGWVRSLFRKAAQALHPDREIDDQKRAGREQRMQQLLAARKQGDLLTMLKLYAEAVGSDEVQIGEKDMEDACDMLRFRLSELKMTHDELVCRTPTHLFLYREVYSPSKKKREQNLRRLQRTLQEDADQFRGVAEKLRNLKVLKEYLEKRRHPLPGDADLDDLLRFLGV
ncbi:MAG: hypothetical protein EA370_12625 [Wenzhouxiangella sp.]|nr:MAG: hypothetical protein EA370_12625 [Wenzhouxiangella sp.]